MDIVLVFLQAHWQEIVLFLLGLNFWVKVGRFSALVKEALADSADGKLSDQEKVRLFDNGWAVIKGFFPNKSKV